MTFATSLAQGQGVSRLAALETCRALFDERERALQRVLAAPHLALDLSLQLELLAHPRVQPVVELALRARIGQRRPRRELRRHAPRLLLQRLHGPHTDDQ